MKILLICNTSDSVINFRRPLIEKFQAEGNTVSVIAFDEQRRDKIEALGVAFYCVRDRNRALNPLKLFSLKKHYLSLIRKIGPSIVFTFMLKPNIFGVRAAKKAGVPKIFSMVEGAGDVFVNNGLKWKLIRVAVCKMYRKSFRYAKKVFFLNGDDKAEFLSRKLVKEEQCEVVPGIGVDLERFAFKPIINHHVFLMVARMLKTKGVMEYCAAARLVRQSHPEAVFNYLGAEGTIRVADIQEYIDDGSICYLGTAEDVRPHLENCVLLLLSSYREGMPMSIMEAEATGRGIVASNSIGCKDTVVEGYNGFLIERGDYRAMAEKCIYILEHPQEADLMGKNSRKFAEEKFDQKEINSKIYEEVTA